MEPWWYVGVQFESDDAWQRVEATLDKGAVTDLEKGDHVARFISGEALPAGRYALMREGSRRMWVVEFGAEPPQGGDALSEEPPAAE